MRYFLLLVFIGLTVGCQQSKKSSSQKAETDSSETVIDSAHLIIPGKQLGKYVINAKAKPLLDELGTPSKGDAAMGKVLQNWKHVEGASLTVYTTRKMGVENFSRLKVVRSESDKFKTKDSLGVGSTLEAVKADFSVIKSGSFVDDNDNEFDLYISAEGIGFEIGEDNICKGVVIMAENTSPQQTYMPIYSYFEAAE